VDGSPCQSCLHCQQPDTDHWREYDVAGSGATPEKLRGWLEAWNRRPTELKHRTLFLDEAHALEKAGDILLKVVEEPAEGIVFVFATTAIEKIRSALQSRLAPLEVMPLPPDDALEFLKSYADLEGMVYDLDALALLAGIKNGHPRNLLIGLEQVHISSTERITLERVKQEFDLDHADTLIGYLCALVGDDVTEAMAVFQLWREPTENKVRWIQCALLSIYYNHVHGRDLVIDPLVASIDRVSISRVLKAFRVAFHVKENSDLHPEFRKMIEFWATPIPIATAGSLTLRVAAFHERVQTMKMDHTVAIGGPASASTLVVDISPRLSATAPPPKRMLRPIIRPEERNFVEGATAQAMFRSASFLMQHFGSHFDTHIELRPDLFGRSDEQGRYDLVCDFCDHLLERWSWSSFIVSADRDQRGFRAIILAHVVEAPRQGESRRESIRSSLEGWRADEQAHKGAVIVREIGPAEHWPAVLHLCSGLAKDVAAPDSRKPLVEALGIKQRIEPGPVGGAVFLTSPSLSPEAIANAEEYGMTFLSAFDDGAWGYVTKNWELYEFRDRNKELKRRKAQIAALKREYAQGSDEYSKRAAELADSWPSDPRERPGRSWSGWWATKEV
jgi:DNA polymerase-3 subunit gamma/tau